MAQRYAKTQLSMGINPTEIILHSDSSVYHLGLKEGDIAPLILTVGDPARVERIAKYFDTIRIKKSHREFITITGKIGGKELSVLSTGMGSDNIDIVLNELDLIANWDLTNRRPKKDRMSLKLIRLGTSGSIQTDIALDSILISNQAVSVDSLHAFYPKINDTPSWQSHLREYFKENNLPTPYCFNSDLVSSISLAEKLDAILGITYTASGFYSPQGRRLFPENSPATDLSSILSNYRFEDNKITNIEMETAALFHLGQLFGHSLTSVSALLANRITGEFSNQPDKTINTMISSVIDLIINEPY